MKKQEKSILEYNDIRDALEYAREEAWKKGFKEGLEEARKERIQKENYRIAKEYLQKGKSIEDMSYITGLSVDQLKELQNTLQT